MRKEKRKNRRFMILPLILALLLAAGSLSACRKEQGGGEVSAASEQESVSTVSASESVSEETEILEMPASLEELHESIEDFAFAPEMEALSAEEKVAKTADFLREMEASGLIEEGSVTEYPEMELVSFRQEDGCLMFVDFREIEDGTMRAEAGFGPDISAKTPAEFYGKYGGPVLREPEYIKKTPSGESKANVVLYSALSYSVSGSLYDFRQLQEFFDASPEMNGEVVLATAREMRHNLKGRDMIILELHGAIYPVDDKPQTCIQVYNDTADMVDPERTEDFLNNRMFCYMGLDSSGKSVLVTMITPAFFAYYYGDGGLSGSIIHMGSCYAFGVASEDEPYGNNYVLSDQLLSCGAEAVVGHHNSVYTIYDEALVFTELEQLKDAKTLKEALDAAIQLHGENDKIYIMENTDGQTTDNFETHVPSKTSIRGNQDAVLFVKTAVESPTSTPEPSSGDDSFTPLHPEAPENPGGTVQPEEPADENWRTAYSRILRQYSSSAKFVLTYADSDLVPELFAAEGGSHADSVDVYTYKQGDTAFLGSLGSFGEIELVPYENTLVSKVEYFGTSDISVYRIDGTSLKLVRSLFTNEGSTMEGVETVYEVDGQNVSEGSYNLALNAVYGGTVFDDAGYGQGYDNTPENRDALINGQKSFMLILG